MAERLADAVSPYLRAHADNPVDWWPWGEDAFAEARRRDVPVLVSIGYSTCHWCHVMARESFSDPAIAAELAAGFVAVKVDREEHPDVDASYLAAASAFTEQLGWPLTVFTTPEGRVFFAGTYFPPEPRAGIPSFRQVIGAVGEAFRDRRREVELSAAAVTEAITARAPSGEAALPGEAELAAAGATLLAQEDPRHGGFGGAPKFPVAPVLAFLAGRADAGDAASAALARRTLAAMSGSGLRDAVEGGFFRYATRADWSEPHYERMLTDNALLLQVATAVAVGSTATGGTDAGPARRVAEGIADFLLDVLRRPSGGFGSAQDSESVIDGARSEGGYYARDAAARAGLAAPSVDEKVVTGWNGLAIGALADAGVRFARPDWVAAARAAADHVLALHLGGGDVAGVLALRRASSGDAVSSALGTLEDAGLLAGGLLRLALASGEPHYAVVARQLIESCVNDGPDGIELGPPGGADPVLAARGLALPTDLGEGASPSGLSALAEAALTLHALTGDAHHRRIAERAVTPAASAAVAQPISFGAALGVLDRLAHPLDQLVVVTPDAADGSDALVAEARAWPRATGTLAIVDESAARAFAERGFELFEARTPREGSAAAYLCRHFVCALPVTSAEALRGLAASGGAPLPPVE